MTSYKVEVQADSSGTWAGNSLRFASRDEADDYGRDLAGRWASVRKWRSVESDDPATHWRAGGITGPVEDLPVRKVTAWAPGSDEEGD
jgi:hypothetical protein